MAQPRTLGYQPDLHAYAEGVIQWHGAVGTPPRRAIVKPFQGMAEVSKRNPGYAAFRRPWVEEYNRFAVLLWNATAIRGMGQIGKGRLSAWGRL
jgi:hypothetical protein